MMRRELLIYALLAGVMLGAGAAAATPQTAPAVAVIQGNPVVLGGACAAGQVATVIAAGSATPTCAVPPVGTPAGATTQVQFNDAGALAGDAGLVFVKGTGALTATGTLTGGNLTTAGDASIGGGDVIATADATIHRNTTDGADNGLIVAHGGGGTGSDPAVLNLRGASLFLGGNEVGTYGGQAVVYPGNVAGSKFGITDSANSFSILSILGADGSSTFTSTVGGSDAATWTFNSTSANGPEIKIQSSGNRVISLGSTKAYDGSGTATTLGAYVTTWPTTASAAAAYVADGDFIKRSTSAAKYKQDVQDITPAEAFKLLSLRPITFRSKIPTDDQAVRHLGLIADEVATAFDPSYSLVTRAKPNVTFPQGEIEGLEYDRLVAVVIAYLQLTTKELAADPAAPPEGLTWLTCTGVSPLRVCVRKLRDGGITRVLQTYAAF